MLQKCVRFMSTHLLSPLGLILIPSETFKNSWGFIEIQLFWDIIEVMAQAASQSRAAAAATVKESIRVLERYIQRDNLSQRLLQTKLDKLTADRDELVAKHYVYGDKSNLSYEYCWRVKVYLNKLRSISKLENLSRFYFLDQDALEHVKTTSLFAEMSSWYSSKVAWKEQNA